MRDQEIVIRLKLPQVGTWPRRLILATSLVAGASAVALAVLPMSPPTFVARTMLTADSLNALSADLSNLDSRVAALEGTQAMPPGTIIAFGGPASLAPKGWLVCDGSSILRSGSPALFAAIGTSWGSASAASFNLPDLRGQFLRGTDDGSGVDPDAASRIALHTGGSVGDAVGSSQGHMLETHQHYIGWGPFMQSFGTGTLAFSNYPYPGTAPHLLSDPAGGSETRPVNVAVTYLIKD